MSSFPPSLQRLIQELSRLPSIGEKTATRLAYHLINNDKKLALSLGESLARAAQLVRQCERCFFLSEEALCSIC